MERMLTRIPEEEFPVFRSALLQNLGEAHWQLPSGDPQSNLARPILCFQRAAAACPPRVSAKEHCRALMHLSLAYTHVTRGNRVHGLNRAIGCYSQAMAV